MARKSKPSSEPQKAIEAETTKEANTTCHISGHVVDRQTRQGMEGVRGAALQYGIRLRPGTTP